MRMRALTGLMGAVVIAVSLAGCAGGADPHPSGSSQQEGTPIGGDIVAPVTMDANDLQGAEVDLVVGQMLNIDTGSLAVDSYSGEVSDPKLAEFVPGRDEGSAKFNPGVSALEPGTVRVMMTNEQDGIQPLEFTVVISKRGS